MRCNLFVKIFLNICHHRSTFFDKLTETNPDSDRLCGEDYLNICRHRSTFVFLRLNPIFSAVMKAETSSFSGTSFYTGFYQIAARFYTQQCSPLFILVEIRRCVE